MDVHGARVCEVHVDGCARTVAVIDDDVSGAARDETVDCGVHFLGEPTALAKTPGTVEVGLVVAAFPSVDAGDALEVGHHVHLHSEALPGSS